MQKVGVDVATILNVTADHLDRYPDVAAYAASKQRIYEHARRAVFNRDDAATEPGGRVAERVSIGLDGPLGDNWGIVEHASARWLTHGTRRLIESSALRIRGRHNEFNSYNFV